MVKENRGGKRVGAGRKFSINQNHQESVSENVWKTCGKVFSINQNHQESVSN